MLHGIGLFCLVLCGWCAGQAAAGRAAARRAALDQTVQLLQRLEQEIQYRRLPLSRLLDELRREASFPLLGLGECESLQQLAPPAVLSAAEQACFAACFSGLGHGGGAQECQRLAYYRARFVRAGEEAADREHQARQLYPRLGLAAGAMLAIAVW